MIFASAPRYCRRCSTETVDYYTTSTDTTATTWGNSNCTCMFDVTMTITATSNYRTYEPPPKCETASAIQMQRIAMWARPRRHPVRRPQRNHGRIVIAPLPRVKLRRWPSLKEKRQAWGYA